ncbi:unnamed protein product [Oikopleura dioica]|uniref:Uncharacterized protein n=1 Tax=Oikopleura dioica TaxID=34765 RepID=E4XZD9_OIKDI|nr:unnamed protein product [Oikopleura dioica]
MKVAFFLSSFFVQSIPVSNKTVSTESESTSKTIKITVLNKDQCPEDMTSICNSEICEEWICPQGTLENDSCVLDSVDEIAGEQMARKYRTCSCHTFLGPIKIFTGCEWKSSDNRPSNLEILPESNSLENSKLLEEPIVVGLGEEFTTQSTAISLTTELTEIMRPQSTLIQKTTETPEELPDIKTLETGEVVGKLGSAELAKNRDEELFETENEDNFMLLDIEEQEKTSDISQIFAGSFISCLRSLPGQAEILCSLEKTTRQCEVTCEEKTEHNVCLCDKDGCFWRNNFNNTCNYYVKTLHHIESVDLKKSQSSNIPEKFKEKETNQRQYKTILRQDGTYVHGYDLMLGLIQEMYNNELMQK